MILAALEGFTHHFLLPLSLFQLRVGFSFSFILFFFLCFFFFFYIPPFLHIFLLGFLAHSLDILLTVKWMEKLQNNREIWKRSPCDMQQLKTESDPPRHPLSLLLLLLLLLPPSQASSTSRNNRGPVEKVTGVLLQKYSKMVEWICCILGHRKPIFTCTSI